MTHLPHIHVEYYQFAYPVLHHVVKVIRTTISVKLILEKKKIRGHQSMKDRQYSSQKKKSQKDK